MPSSFLYPDNAYAPWPDATRHEPPAREAAQDARPLIPDFTQAELRQMVLDVMG